MRDPRDLLDVPGLALELATEEAVTMLAKVGALEAMLRARLAAPVVQSREQPAADKPKDRLLTLPEVAERCRKPKRWLLEHWRREFPSARKKGRTILVPETEVERWLKRP